MQIETKLNINDKVWIMNDNKPCEFSIDDIKISCNSLGYNVEYECHIPGKLNIKADFREYQIGKIAFLNKKDLVNSLF